MISSPFGIKYTKLSEAQVTLKASQIMCWFSFPHICAHYRTLCSEYLCLLQTILFWAIFLYTVINDKQIECIEGLLGKNDASRLNFEVMLLFLKATIL